MARNWNELSARTRRLVVAAAVFEGVLKVAGLVSAVAADVIRPEGYRPPDE